MARTLTLRQVTFGLSLVLAVVTAFIGVLLVVDRPGLHTEYFALAPPWEGRPIYSAVSEPGLETTEQIHEVLRTSVLFSIRWSGWWAVTESGRHRFTLIADDGAYLRIDGKTVIDSREAPGKRQWIGRRKLDSGFHAIEIGHYQTHGRSQLSLSWEPPGSPRQEPQALPVSRLYAGRPLSMRQSLRSGLAAWSRPYRQILGAILLLASFMLLRSLMPATSSPISWFLERTGNLDRRSLRAGLLLALFAAAFLISLPFTGTIRGGDDTSYLTAAQFGEKSWFFNRYAHVYLLKAFVGLSGGNPFVGVRLWWSFVFAISVAALGLATASIGPGLQLKTLAVTIFVLLSQTALLGLIGSGFADYTAMMFITAAVAVYLHGLARSGDGPPPRYDWHALALGALTLAAFRSKEVGAVLLLLPALYLIEDWRLARQTTWQNAGRRFTHRMLFWGTGALGALSALVLLDGLILGDFFFTFDGGRLGKAGAMNFPDTIRPRKDSANWLRIVWAPGGHPAGLTLRNLWIGVAAAAVACGLRRRRLELRLIHLLPVAYFLALIALYIRMPHPFSIRMMIPIIPVACLMTGLLLHHAGLDDISWRRFLTPRLLIPAALSAALFCFIIVPFRLGDIEGAEILPATLLSRFGWKPDVFATGMLLPAAALLVVSVLTLVTTGRRARIAILLIAYVAFFGLGFEFNRSRLAKHKAAQKGELLLYPWRIFHDELDAAHPRRIALSMDLHTRYDMTAATRSSIASLALGRRDLRVSLASDLPVRADMAIASRETYNLWKRREPSLSETAVVGPAGFLVLVRPKDVGKPRSPDPDAGSVAVE